MLTIQEMKQLFQAIGNLQVYRVSGEMFCSQEKVMSILCAFSEGDPIISFDNDQAKLEFRAKQKTTIREDVNAALDAKGWATAERFVTKEQVDAWRAIEPAIREVDANTRGLTDLKDYLDPAKQASEHEKKRVQEFLDRFYKRDRKKSEKTQGLDPKVDPPETMSRRIMEALRRNKP